MNAINIRLERLNESLAKAHREVLALYLHDPDSEELAAETIPPAHLQPLIDALHLARTDAANLRDFP